LGPQLVAFPRTTLEGVVNGEKLVGRGWCVQGEGGGGDCEAGETARQRLCIGQVGGVTTQLECLSDTAVSQCSLILHDVLT
jgi:hypothetical protein